MAQNAKARVDAYFLWSQKAAQVREVYDWTRAQSRSAKPDIFKADLRPSSVKSA
jgi:hypothetical protein